MNGGIMRKFWFISRILFSVLLIAVILNSCGTTSMYIKVKRPAEINLKGYQKIAIGDMVNQQNRVDKHSRDLSDEFTSTLFKSGYFEVLDREHLAKILEEQGLAQTGLIDESSAVEIGNIIGAAAFVFGRTQNDKYKENTSKGKPTKDKEGKIQQSFYRDGEFNLSVNVKIIDIQTAKILGVKTLTSRRTQRKTGKNSPAPRIDPNSLYRQCLNDISAQFMKLVAPHVVSVRANFETDDDLPEVKQAISFFKIGEWDDGLNLLQKATEKTKLKNEVKAKAFYNLGLAQTYSGEFDDALANLKKALKLNSKSSRYQRAIMNAKSEREKAEKLKEQL
jgi:curli biogenesis system outer membrane secretion channel CsgG